MCSVGGGNAHLIGKITRRHFVPGTNEPSNKNSSFYSSAYVSKNSRPEEFGFVWNIVHRDKNGRGWNPGDINISDMRLFKDPPWPPFRSSFDFQQSLGKKKISASHRLPDTACRHRCCWLRFFSSRVFLSKRQLQNEEHGHVLSILPPSRGLPGERPIPL